MPALAALALLLPALGCGSTVDGNQPVGGQSASPIEQERFLGRLHLDLTGSRASDSFIGDGLDKLATAGDEAAVRAELAAPLVDSPEFADLWIAELENTAFGGETAEARYDLLCGIIRASDDACVACAPSSDPCGGCSCPALTSIVSEREALRGSAADLAGGATTAEIGKRYARTQPFRALQDPDTTVRSLFQSFLGRPPEGEELRNGRAMVFGLALMGAPSGLLFHRHGTDYDDLVNIVFQSEVYREAQVAAVFERYLGRPPTFDERAHFAAQVDPDDPDIRPLVRAVVSSREYFDQ